MCEVPLPHLRPAVHRTILIVDIENFGNLARTNEHQIILRAGLYRALERAFEIAGIPWNDCRREDRGDGVYILAPSLVPKARFVEDVPSALAAELRGHNESHASEARIRLRMALHAGEVRFDDHGEISPASILAFRLVEAPSFKSALAAAHTDLALIVSPWFYAEVVRHNPAAKPEDFREVTVTVKETTTSAWIKLVAESGTVPTPITDRFFDTVDVLELMPCMSTEHDRALVIKQLRPAIAGAIRYHPQRRAHVMSILDACRDYDDGITDLVNAISKIERSGSLPLQRLIDLLGYSG